MVCQTQCRLYYYFYSGNVCYSTPILKFCSDASRGETQNGREPAHYESQFARKPVFGCEEGGVHPTPGSLAPSALSHWGYLCTPLRENPFCHLFGEGSRSGGVRSHCTCPALINLIVFFRVVVQFLSRPTERPRTAGIPCQGHANDLYPDSH